MPEKQMENNECECLKRKTEKKEGLKKGHSIETYVRRGSKTYMHLGKGEDASWSDTGFYLYTGPKKSSQRVNVCVQAEK